MNIKLYLLIFALVITIGTFYYTQNLVSDLEESERQIVQLYANSLQFIASTTSTESEDFTFIFENIIKRINFPLILTDAEGNPINYSIGSGIKNIEIDTSLSPAEVDTFLREKIKELEKIHKPIDVLYESPNNVKQVFNRIYFGNSETIQQLKYYPFLQIIFAIFFIGIAYASFKYLKKTEESNIWIGMAKEIAHQLGTPISSLMGWMELIRLKSNYPKKIMEITHDMEGDLTRLNKITNRFSKIGSKPNLKEADVISTINSVANYFEKRLPQTGKNVEIVFPKHNPIIVKLNYTLFEWVIENLIKNAIDAIGSDKGKIIISTKCSNEYVHIEISDNGKGISSKNKKKIFKPGFSTKSRGWGLGLSLSKRIIEDYHKGRLILKQSIPNEGTTFLIELFRERDNNRSNNG